MLAAAPRVRAAVRTVQRVHVDLLQASADELLAFGGEAGRDLGELEPDQQQVDRHTAQLELDHGHEGVRQRLQAVQVGLRAQEAEQASAQAAVFEEVAALDKVGHDGSDIHVCARQQRAERVGSQ